MKIDIILWFMYKISVITYCENAMYIDYNSKSFYRLLCFIISANYRDMLGRIGFFEHHSNDIMYITIHDAVMHAESEYVLVSVEKNLMEVFTIKRRCNYTPFHILHLYI